LIFFNK
jgi:hypothetical protein